MVRDQRVTVTVTEDEYQAIRRAVFVAGYNSLSTFLYEELFKPALDTRPIFLDEESETSDVTPASNGNTPAAEKVPA